MSSSEMKHVFWTKIRSFHNVIGQNRKIKNSKTSKNIIFKGKIKLHGQNAGITIGEPDSGECKPNVVTQTRRHIVGKEFAAGEVVFPLNVDFFENLWFHFRKTFQSDEMQKIKQFTIFGEWCGKGIQKNVAVSEVNEKIFAIFAINFGTFLMVNPDEILNFMTMNQTIAIPSRIFILPWQTNEFIIDFKHEEKLSSVLDEIDELVNKYCQCDPWVEETFGIQGLGEGLVLYPISKFIQTEHKEFTFLSCFDFGKFGFKAKGEQFRVVENKKSATLKVPKPGCPAVISFVHMICTEARLQQGVTEVNAIARPDIGDLMKWIYKDVQNECGLELEESGFTFKMIRKELGRRIKDWFFDQCDTK